MLSGTIEVRAGRTSHSVDVPTPCSKKAGADPPGSFTSLSEIPLEKVEKAFLHFVSQFTKRQRHQMYTDERPLHIAGFQGLLAPNARLQGSEHTT